MPRTVLGWRCRRGSGRSLPTSYTSPQAGNKPPVVFPIHTDRGRHCLTGFTPRDLHGPWLTHPSENMYSCSTLALSVFLTEVSWDAQSGEPLTQSVDRKEAQPVFIYGLKKLKACARFLSWSLSFGC